jgi:uncharacterized membrane protein YhaH (DUF805 family)
MAGGGCRREHRVMDWTWYLFGFKGRINRAKYWLAGLVIRVPPRRLSFANFGKQWALADSRCWCLVDLKSLTELSACAAGTSNQRH